MVYLRLADRLRSATGNTLWTAEAWYTLNAIPGSCASGTAAQAADAGWRDLFDGRTLAGWRNYGGDENDVRKWTVQDGALALVQEGPFPMWDLIKSVVVWRARWRPGLLPREIPGFRTQPAVEDCPGRQQRDFLPGER